MRRLLVGACCVVALLGASPVRALANTASAAKTVDAQCHAFGKLAMSPALTPTAQPETFTITGDFEGYPGGDCPGDDATYQGTLTTPAAYCDVRSILGDAARGTILVTWSDSTTSTISIHLRDDPKVAYAEMRISGKVRAGRFVGDRLGGRVLLFDATGTCAAGDGETSTAFRSGPSGHESPLTLSHH